MLDSGLLKTYSLVALVTAMLFFLDGKGSVAAGAMLVISMFCLLLSWSIKPNKIDIVVKDLFEDNFFVNEFKEKFSKDPEFNQALVYVHKLDRADFLRFFRLCVETRFQADRRVLKEIRSIYKNG